MNYYSELQNCFKFICRKKLEGGNVFKYWLLQLDEHIEKNILFLG